MILTDVQEYVREQRQVSLEQLARRFDVQPAALRGMLDRLSLKGRVRRLERPDRCTGCRICPEAALELYAWAGAAPADDRPPACPRAPVPAAGGCSRC